MSAYISQNASFALFFTTVDQTAYNLLSLPSKGFDKEYYNIITQAWELHFLKLVFQNI